ERGAARGDVLATGEDPRDARLARTREHRIDVAGELRVRQMRVRVYQGLAGSRRGKSGGPTVTLRPGSSRPHRATSGHGAAAGDGNPSWAAIASAAFGMYGQRRCATIRRASSPA